MTRTAAAACLLLFFALTGTPAAAQQTERGGVFAGISSLRELGTDGSPAVDYDLGWTAGVEIPLGWWGLSAVGDLGVNRRTNIVDETQELMGLTAGVRSTLWRPGPARAFAQVLAGIERFSEPGFSEVGPAFQPGAGVEVGIWRRLAVAAQADLRISRQSDATYRSLRLSGLAVLKW